MPTPVDSPRFIGLIGPVGADIPTADLAAELRRAGATINTVPGSHAALATWPGSRLGFEKSQDGIALVSVGHPRHVNDRPINSLAKQFANSDRSLVNDLRGDYALAVIDGERRRALLAVDRVGIGALYFGKTADGTFVFASDLSLIRAFSGANCAIDPQAIYGYTYYHAIPSPQTIYTGFSRVPPGHSVMYADDKVSLQRHWYPNFSAPRDHSQAQLEAELMEVLRSSVGHCSGDAAIGGFLSGGLDSSTVCGMLREAAGRKVPAVSVGFDEEGYDETAFAKTAAEHFDLDLIVHYMTPDEIADSIGLIVENYAEPFGNSSVVPSYICALTAAQNGITTLLAGDGGDELFAGNTRYAKQKLFEYYLKLPAPLRSGITDRLFDGPDRSWQVGPLRKIHRYVSQANIRLPHRLQTFNLLEMQQPDSVFCSSFLAAVDTGHPQQLLSDEYGAVDADPVNRMLFSDWRFTLADNDLRKVTGTCQLAGVDVRFPLLDDEVIDFSIKVPASLKLKGLKLRYFYRHALRDYLPDAVLNKSKHGFGLPFGEWLKTSDRLQEMVSEALSSLRKRGIFTHSFVDSLIEAHRHQHAAFYGNMVWVLAMLEWWLAAHEPGFSFSD